MFQLKLFNRSQINTKKHVANLANALSEDKPANNESYKSTNCDASNCCHGQNNIADVAGSFNWNVNGQTILDR